MARMGKKEKRLWVFFLNDKNRIQYNEQCKKCVHECKQSFRCRIVWCGKYYSKRRKRQCLLFILFGTSKDVPAMNKMLWIILVNV